MDKPISVGYPRFMLISLVLLPILSLAGPLPSGVCPFDPAQVASAFSPSIVKNLGSEMIAYNFHWREEWYGRCKAVKKVAGNNYLFQYADAQVPVELEFKGGKLNSYSFSGGWVQEDSWDKLLAMFKRVLPGSSLYCADANGGEVRAAFQETKFLPIGEGRILLEASAIERKVKEGALRNEQVITLKDSDKYFAMGDLADKKPGFRFTLAELKQFVFGDLDYNGGDIMLRLLGREAMEAGRPLGKPFLSGREQAWLFTLSPSALDSLKREDSLKVAQSLEKLNVMPPASGARFDHLEKTEWLGSAKELCGALSTLASLPELKKASASRNFGEAHPNWKNAVYYASSKPGLSQNSWLATLPGTLKPTCLTLLLNNGGEVDPDFVSEILDRANKLLSKK